MNRLSRLLPSLTLSLLTLGAVPAVHAEAPQVRTQVPGYQRHMVGQFEVTALYDGRIQLDSKLLKNATPKEISQLLARSFRSSPTPTAVIAFLVNTGKQLVLVDAGAAQLFGPSLGQVHANLKAAGYQPEQVDAVLLTHLHGDHVGGLRTAEGQMAMFAGLPQEVPGATVNRLCGSGLDAVGSAARAIRAGEAGLMIASQALVQLGAGHPPAVGIAGRQQLQGPDQNLAELAHLRWLADGQGRIDARCSHSKPLGKMVCLDGRWADGGWQSACAGNPRFSAAAATID